MSGDIVERLRRAADTSASGGGEWYQLVHRCREAADEIERLRSALRFAKAVPHGCSTGFVPCWCES